MVTTPEAQPTGPTREERVEEVARIIIAGHPFGAVRRILLYVLMFTAMGVSYYVPPLIVVALAAGILLATTDMLA